MSQRLCSFRHVCKPGRSIGARTDLFGVGLLAPPSTCRRRWPSKVGTQRTKRGDHHLHICRLIGFYIFIVPFLLNFCMYLPQVGSFPPSLRIDCLLPVHSASGGELVRAWVVGCSVPAPLFFSAPLQTRQEYRSKNGPFRSRIACAPPLAVGDDLRS